MFNDYGYFDSITENIKKVMDWFSMRRCRHYLIDGQRQRALLVYRSMNKKTISKKDLAVNALLLMLPGAVVRKIFEVRWRKKA